MIEIEKLMCGVTKGYEDLVILDTHVPSIAQIDAVPSKERTVVRCDGGQGSMCSLRKGCSCRLRRGMRESKDDK